jgi:hypothetical protein
MKEKAKYTGESMENFKHIMLLVSLVHMGLKGLSLLYFSTQSQLNHNQYMLQLMLITSVSAAANSRSPLFHTLKVFICLNLIIYILRGKPIPHNESFKAANLFR